MTPLQIAYILLTIACCTGFLAALFHHEKTKSISFLYVPGILLLAICTNIARRALRIHLPDDLLAPRMLFFVWPFCCAMLLLLSFGKRILAGFVCTSFGLLYLAFVFVPDVFTGRITQLAQLISAGIGIAVLPLLVQTRKRRPYALSPAEIAGVYCGVAEGLTAFVGFMIPRDWWPTVLVYSALYVSLIFLFLVVLWKARPNNSERLNRA